MVIRHTPFSVGTPCWVDLYTSDLAKAKTFYEGVFGWEVPEGSAEFGGYITALSGGEAVAGMMGNTPDSGNPDGWTTYLASDNIQASVDACVAAGATLLAPAMEVGAHGSMAVLFDSAGAGFGIWQAGQHTGFNVYNEPGAVTWNELHTKDFAKATEFYRAAFGWDLEAMSDTDEFRYTNGKIDGQQVAGVLDAAGFLPAEAPSEWVIYFSVEDTDEAIAKALELGGTLNQPAEDSPFGRVADVSDPTGVRLKLHSNKLASA